MPRLDAVRKRLREISELKARLADGHELEKNQLLKIKLEAQYAFELAALEEAAKNAHEQIAASADGEQSAGRADLKDVLRAACAGTAQADGPLLAMLQVLHQQDRLRAVLRSWAAREPNAAEGLASPQYKLRSVATAIEHMEQLREMSAAGARPEVVLYGDSMFERMSTKFNGSFAARLGAPDRAFVHAVGGDGVEHLMLRLHMSHDDWFRSCRAFVIDIGANNVLGGKTQATGVEATSNRADPAAIAAAIQRIVTFVRARCDRGAAVYVCHLLHVYGSPTLDNASELNRAIDAVNAHIDGLHGCQVVKLRMARDKRNFDADGLHLSRTGYALFARQLAEAVPELQPAARPACTPAAARLPVPAAAAAAGTSAAPASHVTGTVTVGSLVTRRDGGGRRGEGGGSTPAVGGATEVRVDRQSVLGNPFPMGKDGRDERLRDAVCDAFAELLGAPGERTAAEAAVAAATADEQTIARRHGLGSVDGRFVGRAAERAAAIESLAKRVASGESLRLMCWCAPKRCHAEAIAGCVHTRALELLQGPSPSAPLATIGMAPPSP